MRSRYRRQLDFLVRLFQPGPALGLSLTGSLALLTLTGWAFGVVVQDVLSGDSFNPVDRPVLDFLAAHREPWLTSTATAVSALGSSAVLVPVRAAAALWFRWRRGTWRQAALLGGGYAGTVGLYGLVKLLVARPRPPSELAVRHFGGYAFPSGHATQAVVACWAAALLVGVLVGATRLYLGAHWCTDVIGGLVLGALWLAAILTLSRSVPVRPGTRRSRSPSPRPTPAQPRLGRSGGRRRR